MVAKGDVESGADGGGGDRGDLFMVTGLSSGNLQKLDKAPPGDFEAAVAAAGYGRFNLLLMLCSVPAFWSAVSVTSSVSYIFARARCDMQLSLVDMGTVTGITYGGMMASAVLWGYLSDTLGRRRIMVGGFLASGALEVVAALSQTFAMLLVTRFLCGFLFNGPFAVLISYMAELHRTELRSRSILLSSLFYTIGSTTLPILAWGWLTEDITIHLFGGSFVIHAWNLFLLSTALPPLLAGLAFLCMPESPKFLMSRGRNQEALAVFQRMFVMNTGKKVEEYPETMRASGILITDVFISISIKCLVEEKTAQSARGLAALKGGFAQLLPLFRPPHVWLLLLMCLCNCCCMLGANTLRLWYPQLAAMINSDTSESLCSAIATASAPAPAPAAPAAPAGDVAACVPIRTDLMTYLQSAIVGAGAIITYGIGGAIVNKCGKKLVYGVCGVLSAALALSLPATSGAYPIVALMTTALAFTALAGSTLAGIAVDVFPTSLRAMAMAVFLMCGRMGTMMGTAAFPALVNYGCYPPFIAVSTVLLMTSFLCFLLPNTTLKKME